MLVLLTVLGTSTNTNTSPGRAGFHIFFSQPAKIIGLVVVVWYGRFQTRNILYIFTQLFACYTLYSKMHASLSQMLI